jgi:hypothetical protein
MKQHCRLALLVPDSWWFLDWLIRPWRWSRTCSSEMSVDFQWTTRRCNPEDETVHNHRCGNLEYYVSRRLLIEWLGKSTIVGVPVETRIRNVPTTNYFETKSPTVVQLVSQSPRCSSNVRHKRFVPVDPSNAVSDLLGFVCVSELVSLGPQLSYRHLLQHLTTNYKLNFGNWKR